MQQDRIEGNVERHPDDRLYQEYKALNAKNMVPDLPRSSHIKIISGTSAGEIHPWMESFANRPDMCVNCDVNGNTDPAVWRHSVTPARATVEQNNIPASFSGEVPGHVPQVQNAAEVLGIDPNYTQDYTSPTLVKAALPLPRQSGGEVVADVIKVSFDNFI